MIIHEWTNDENQATILSWTEVEPFELNALDFFVNAYSYFEEEVEGKLSPSRQSPASFFRSESFTQKILSIRSVLVEEEEESTSY